jgi:hypothetical protein
MISAEKRWSTMTFLRNRPLLGGILLGGVCGVVIGSVIAFTLGDSSVDAVRRRLQERNRGKVPFEYFSQ